jgi:hypothetical protein
MRFGVDANILVAHLLGPEFALGNGVSAPPLTLSELGGLQRSQRFKNPHPPSPIYILNQK